MADEKLTVGETVWMWFICVTFALGVLGVIWDVAVMVWCPSHLHWPTRCA